MKNLLFTDMSRRLSGARKPVKTHSAIVFRLMHCAPMLAAISLCVSSATAEIKSEVSIDVTVTDFEFTGVFNFEDETDDDRDEINTVGSAFAELPILSPFLFQDHYSVVNAEIDISLFPTKAVSMRTLRLHEFEKLGNDEDHTWHASNVEFHSSSSLDDILTMVTLTPERPQFQTVEFFFQVTGANTQIIDIRPDEQPHYRLQDHVQFKANAGGREVEPVDVEFRVFDVHTQPPITSEFSAMTEDVNFIATKLVPEILQNYSLEVELEPVIEFGNVAGYLTSLDMDLIVDSVYKFRNDGPGVNLFMKGQIVLDVSNSADLLGILVRDETGAIRTDVEVSSAEGVNYPILSAPIMPPPPPSGPTILSPIGVTETGLGTFDQELGPSNMIDQSGLGKPFTSGHTLFNEYVFEGDRPTADDDFNNYWQSEVSGDGQYSGTLDFDLGGEYIVDRMAIWNGTLENGELWFASSPEGPWESVGAITLENQNPIMFPLVEPQVLEFTDPLQARYVRIEVDSTYPLVSNQTFEYAIVREVAFSVSPVPEPGGQVLMALAGVGWSAFFRRRRWPLAQNVHDG